MRSLLLVLILSLTGSAAVAAVDTSNVAPEIVALPEFQVYTKRELPPPENWYYTQIGNFEILSNASKRNTTRFVRDFYKFQNVLTILAPAARIRAQLPVAVVLCGAGRQYDKITRLAKGGRSLSSRYGSVLVSDEEISAIVINLEARTVELNDGTEVEFSPDEAFYREFYKLVINRTKPTPPSWLVEGMSRLVSKTDFTNKWIDFGNLEPFMRPGVDSWVKARIRRGFAVGDASMEGGGFGGSRGLGMDGFGRSGGYSGRSMRPTTEVEYVPIELMPLGRFFAQASDPIAQFGATARDSKFSGIWPKQATVFVHMCLYNHDAKYQKGFLKFVERATREEVSEEMFFQCFGLTYEKMLRAMEDYISYARHKHLVVNAKKGESFTEVPDFEVRSATPAEVGRIKGEAYRLANNPERAKEEFVTAYLRGERDPQLLASLGLMARQAGDMKRARTYLEHVGGVEVPRPRAYIELARSRREELRSAAAADKLLEAEQVASLLEPLFVTFKLRPILVDTYLEIAAVWDQSAAKPTKENLAVLLEGCGYYPRHLPLLEATIELHNKHGYGDAVTPLAARIEPLKQHLATMQARFSPVDDAVGKQASPAAADRKTTGASRREPVQVNARRPFTGEYFELRDVDVRPATDSPLKASFTSTSATAAEPTPVVLAFVVTPDGSPAQIQVLSQSPDEAGAAAVKALENTRFTPGQKAGKAVSTAVVRTVMVAASK